LIHDFPAKSFFSQLLSYGTGAVWSFVWNRKYTFESFGSWSGQFIKFLLVQIALAGLSALMVWLLSEALFDVHPTVSWFIVMTVITVLNFKLLRKYVFVTL
jgi:putative flippase GtrA